MCIGYHLITILEKNLTQAFPKDPCVFTLIKQMKQTFLIMHAVSITSCMMHLLKLQFIQDLTVS